MRLPQYCCTHPRDKFRSFKLEEGKLIYNKTRFKCFDCIKRHRRSNHIREAYSVSSGEAEMLQELYRSGKNFKRRFRIGKWEFDYAFMDERILLEIDGYNHTFDKQKNIDRIKGKEAEAKGWRVVRVRYGPGMLHRVAVALGS